jgi:hypothetical protein
MIVNIPDKEILMPNQLYNNALPKLILVYHARNKLSHFGCFPSVWFILADVSDPSVRSIFKSLKPLKMDLTEGSETSAKINQTLGKPPQLDTVNTEHSKSLKSRNKCFRKRKQSNWVFLVHKSNACFIFQIMINAQRDRYICVRVRARSLQLKLLNYE